MGGAQCRAVPGEQASRAVRQEEALMRVERDGVRALDPLQCRSASPGELEEAAVSRIDVQPEPLTLRDARDGYERIHHAGVDRAGRGDHEERSTTGGPVPLDRLDECP